MSLPAQSRYIPASTGGVMRPLKPGRDSMNTDWILRWDKYAKHISQMLLIIILFILFHQGSQSTQDSGNSQFTKQAVVFNLDFTFGLKLLVKVLISTLGSTVGAARTTEGDGHGGCLTLCICHNPQTCAAQKGNPKIHGRLWLKIMC